MRQTDSISDLALEQYVLGELSPQAHARISERLGSDSALQARLAALHQSDDALRAAYPVEIVASAIRRRAQGPSPSARPWTAWLGFALTASLVVALVVPTLWHRNAQQERLKGETSGFVVERVTAGTPPQALLSGDHGHAGDVLQMALHPPLPAFVAVVSIDGSGHATQLVPQGNAQQALPTAGMGAAYLPVTYTLDDAPYFERIFLVGAAAAFDTQAVMAAAQQLAVDPGAQDLALPLTSSFSQTSILILKD